MKFILDGLIKPAFNNLNLNPKGWTWRREPILWLTLLVAVVNIVIAVLAGDQDWITAVETIVVYVVGFLARGQVTPTNDPRGIFPPVIQE